MTRSIYGSDAIGSNSWWGRKFRTVVSGDVCNTQATCSAANPVATMLRMFTSVEVD